MPNVLDRSTYSAFHRFIGGNAPACWMVATPEVRRRLLGLAVVVLAPAVLPHDIQAQQSASGHVRLVIRADVAAPEAFDDSTRPIPWMAPESARETERLAGLWARGDDAGALEAWKAVVRAEVAAERLATLAQAEAAADWIVDRVARVTVNGRGYDGSRLTDQEADEIRVLAREAAVASLAEPRAGSPR